METNGKTELSSNKNFALCLEGRGEDGVEVLTLGVGRVDKVDLGVGAVPAQLGASKETALG
jgi:hypothetical protein